MDEITPPTPSGPAGPFLPPTLAARPARTPASSTSSPTTGQDDAPPVGAPCLSESGSPPIVPPPARQQTSPAHPRTDRTVPSEDTQQGRSKLATLLGAVAIVAGGVITAAFLTGQFNAADPFLVPDPDAAATASDVPTAAGEVAAPDPTNPSELFPEDDP